MKFKRTKNIYENVSFLSGHPVYGEKGNKYKINYDRFSSFRNVFQDVTEKY